MFSGLNLSRRDAWTRVSQYVGLWLVFWLLVGIAGQTLTDASSSTREVVDIAANNTPLPPRLLDSEQTLTVRGRIERLPQNSRRTDYARAERSAVHARRAGTPSKGPVETTGSSTAGFSGFTSSAPPGFADLLGVQNTQADVYFHGRPLLSTFIEFDLTHLWFMAPEEVVEAIPTLKNPERVLAAISGQLDNNSALLCSVRVRTNCGDLEPDVAGVIFDEGKFRIDLFIATDELEVQMLVGDRYLPMPTAGWGTLHDMSFSASGQFGNDRYSLAGESFLAKGSARARVRYGVTNNSPSLHEASLQWDKKDREYELGAFRSARGNSLFVNDVRLVGLRLGSSTKTRTDLDNALATPIFAFLERRSRVDILRDGEILDSRYYDAGNHQLDTTRLPDGAYDVTVKTVAADGRESLETHFFVRDSLLPPLGEQQYFLEAGLFTEDYGSRLPQTTGGGWVRTGLSRRFTESFALEAEALVSNEVNLLQGGAYFLGRGWQVHAGVMGSDRGDSGFSFRGQFNRKGYGLSVNAQHLDSKTNFDQGALERNRIDPLLGSNVEIAALDSETLGIGLLDTQSVLGGSYTQASASLSFPLRLPLLRGKFSSGRAQIRARYNKRGEGKADKGIGINYYAPLFKRRHIAADLNFEGLYSNNRSLVRVGVDFRWRDQRQSSLVRPELVASRAVDPISGERGATSHNPTLSAYWNRNRRTENFGDLSEGLYLNHDNSRSVVGSRLSSQSQYGFSELDLSYQSDRRGGRDGLAYATNSRFSLVSTEGKSALGGGNSQLAAIVVEIDADLPDADFQVIVDSRVAGYASSAKRAVISVRPYESYNVRVVPAGDSILGYDERSVEVTLFPGNVHRVVFSARALHVLVSQALFADGTPVTHAKFLNVEGFGATDSEGWFQVELSHREPLALRLPSGEHCELTQPAPRPEDENLIVVDALVCRSIPEPPSG